MNDYNKTETDLQIYRTNLQVGKGKAGRAS